MQRQAQIDARHAEAEARARPLIAHVIYGLKTGGLENGLVNLINGLPGTEFRHGVIALTQASDFRRRIAREDALVPRHWGGRRMRRPYRNL